MKLISGFLSLAFAPIIIMLSSYTQIGTTIVLGLFFVLQLVLSYKENRNILSLNFVFTASWWGTIFLSSFKWHPAQRDWSMLTWMILFGAYVFYILGFELIKHINNNRKNRVGKVVDNIDPIKYKKWLMVYLLIVLFSFALEVMICGLPAFSDDMSAYVEFGLPFIHYITVSCILLPPMTFYYWYKLINKQFNFEIILIIIMTIVGAIIPVLIVSRQLMFTEIFVFVILFYYIKKESPGFKMLFTVASIVLLSWIGISELRNQYDDYLNVVLEFDRFEIEDMPLALKYFYTDICLNYDNLDLNIDKLNEFAYGRYEILPILRVFGFGKIFPDLFEVDIETFKVMEVFTTYPMCFVGYRDFGTLGALAYMFFVGLICGYIEKIKYESIFDYIMYAICIYGMLFSFFYSYLSVE